MRKRNSLKQIGTAVLLALLLCAALNPAATFAEEGEYPPALPLPKLSGDQVKDILAVARSQVGYTSSATNLSVYWVWAGSIGKTNSWCTEFVCWCASSAQIPESVVPLKWSSAGLRSFFAEKSAYYSVSGGCTSSTCGCRALSAKTIAVDEIQPGDILLIDTDGNMDNGPDHTVLVEKYENGILYSIEGNMGGQRYDDGTKGYATVSLNQRNAPRFDRIHGICRPSYHTLPAEKTDIAGADVNSIPDQVYTGKAIQPKLTVTCEGKTLVQDTDYTAAYSDNKNIGTAAVTITGIGNYTGMKSVSFTIIPKKVNLSSLKAGKKLLTVKWKAGSGIDGYEIEYGLKKSFKGAKKITVKKAKTTEYQIKKLKAKKTYYVRIRAYKKVKGKKYYSEWSKVLSKKTKK